jgi:ABC-2 type transport system permease protein
VGLVQVGLWAGTATFLSGQRVAIAKVLGAPEAANGFAMPAMSPQLLVVFLTFFVLGFLLYSAAYAAIGSMCSSDQETRQAQGPVTLCILAGLLCMFALVGEPNGTLARGLSLVPLVAPFVTPVRYSLDPMPVGEVLLSVASTIVGLVVVVWVASRIYRIGILSYGKKPSFADVWRWIRTA